MKDFKKLLQNKKYLLCVFALQLLALNIPNIQKQIIKKYGELHTFETIPLDPRDLFRGRYLILNFKENEKEFPYLDACNFFHRKEALYVEVIKNGEFSQLNRISKNPEFTQYLEIKDYRCYNNKIKVDLPFSRYYVNEYEAPRLEKEAKKAKLNVYIHRGNYAVENLEAL